jgi:hypothetical protein
MLTQLTLDPSPRLGAVSPKLVGAYARQAHSGCATPFHIFHRRSNMPALKALFPRQHKGRSHGLQPAETRSSPIARILRDRRADPAAAERRRERLRGCTSPDDAEPDPSSVFCRYMALLLKLGVPPGGALSPLPGGLVFRPGHPPICA